MKLTCGLFLLIAPVALIPRLLLAEPGSSDEPPVWLHLNDMRRGKDIVHLRSRWESMAPVCQNFAQGISLSLRKSESIKADIEERSAAIFNSCMNDDGWSRLSASEFERRHPSLFQRYFRGTSDHPFLERGNPRRDRDPRSNWTLPPPS